MNARNHRKRTPLHVAAEEGEEDFITFLLSNKADANIPDRDGYTPLDLAAKYKHEDVVKILLQHPPSSAKDSTVQMTLEQVMAYGQDHDIKDGLVKETVSEISPFGYAMQVLLYLFINIMLKYFPRLSIGKCSVVSMLKSKNCGGEGKFKFIKDFARNPRLKVNDVVYIKLQPVQPRQL